ncbi:MAG: tetratricopeptide repeat protein [Pseudomonadota bacterium]
MSDESFIREVEEELRSDQLKSFWERFKWFIITGAVAIVVLTAGYRGWLYFSQEQANVSGDQFIQALELSDGGQLDEAIAKLETLSNEGSGEYPALARIRLAAEYAKQEEYDRAVEAFDSIANDTGFDATLRDVARLRAGLLLVDSGSYDDVANRLQQLSGAAEPFRHTAREGLGLSAWKAKDFETAHRWFSDISSDIAAPSGIRSRAGIMLDLLSGIGFTGAEEDSSDEG